MVGIKPTNNPLQTTPFDAFTEDSALDLGLCGIDLGHREPPARTIGLPNEIVAATAASDAAGPYARAKRLVVRDWIASSSIWWPTPPIKVVAASIAFRNATSYPFA